MMEFSGIWFTIFQSLALFVVSDYFRPPPESRGKSKTGDSDRSEPPADDAR